MLIGMLYTQLAMGWIVRGEMEIARTVYEEGIQSVATIRDFTIIYAAYIQFEEIYIDYLSSNMLEEDDDDNDDDDDATMDDEKEETDTDDWDILLLQQKEEEEEESIEQSSSSLNKKKDTTTTTTSTTELLELAIARAEHLTIRRPLLLNAVQLRQNPTNIDAYIERAELYLKQLSEKELN